MSRWRRGSAPQVAVELERLHQANPEEPLPKKMKVGTPPQTPFDTSTTTSTTSTSTQPLTRGAIL